MNTRRAGFGVDETAVGAIVDRVTVVTLVQYLVRFYAEIVNDPIECVKLDVISRPSVERNRSASENGIHFVSHQFVESDQYFLYDGRRCGALE